MPEGYSAQGFVSKKATKSMVKDFLPLILLVVGGIVGIISFFIWRKRKNQKSSKN
jgi:cytoskeletal protein RodZ